MADTFTWLPDDKPTGSIDHRVRSVQFGDGYRQIVKDGINTRTQRWPLTFDRGQNITDAIVDFLDAHEGEWFFWTPPGSNAVQNKFISLGYTKTPYQGSNERITVTFEEFHAP